MKEKAVKIKAELEGKLSALNLKIQEIKRVQSQLELEVHKTVGGITALNLVLDPSSLDGSEDKKKKSKQEE